jgi:glycine betaine/proline transport system ATP-binding protein
MKDGEIVQTGTAAEIVLTPSTSYVAEFTRDVPRAKVLTASSLMEPLSGTADAGGPRVTAKTGVRELASLLAQPASEAIVVDDENRPLGRVRRDTIVDVLMDVSPRHACQPQDDG